MTKPSGKAFRPRKGTKRSHHGCITCKIRRVKCDEGRPTCERCKRFGIKCDGYAEKKIPTVPPDGYRIQPKPSVVNRVSVPTPLPILDFENENERVYFSLFERKTSKDIAPYFDPEAWRRLILQSCHVPSIRYAVLAIAALDRVTMDVLDHRNLFLDSNSAPVYGIHHQMAIYHYTKAIKTMRSAMASGRQDLRITLITCLLVAAFEMFHGNYPLANAQIRTGIELLYDWKTAFPNKYILSYSPNSKVVENELCQIFGRLQLTVIYPDNKIPSERREARNIYLEEILRNIPEVFNSLQDALVHIEVLLARLELYYQASGVWPSKTGDQESLLSRVALGASWQKTCTDSRFKFTPLTNFAVTRLAPNLQDTQHDARVVDGEKHRNPLRHADEYGKFSGDSLDILSQSSRSFTEPALDFSSITCVEANRGEKGKTMRDQHLKEILRWRSAFESLMARPGMIKTPNSTLLHLHIKTSYMCVATFSSGLMIFDKFTDVMWDIVNDARWLIENSPTPKQSKSTLDFGIIIPLYFVGIKCRVSAVRKAAINILLSNPRREGYWDSGLVGRIIGWIQEIEEEFANGGVVPVWARVPPADIVFDLKEPNSRIAHLMCCQRTSVDSSEMRQRKTVISW